MQTFKIGDYVVFAKEGETFSGTNKGTNKDIWLIEKIYLNSKSVILKSICRDTGFETNLSGVVAVEKLRKLGLFNRKYFHKDSYDAYWNLDEDKINPDLISSYDDNTIVGDTKMNSTNDMVKRTMNTNTQAAKVAATITAGKTLNTLVANKVVPQLPLMVKGYADTALGRVVIANIADFAVKQFMPGNAKANMASNAMMQAAMLELADSFDLESIVTELVDSVAIPEAD